MAIFETLFNESTQAWKEPSSRLRPITSHSVSTLEFSHVMPRNGVVHDRSGGCGTDVLNMQVSRGVIERQPEHGCIESVRSESAGFWCRLSTAMYSVTVSLIGLSQLVPCPEHLFLS